MNGILHLIASEPLAVALVGLCLLVVGGLLLSDWGEKRRERELLLLRARLRAQRSGLDDPELRQALQANRPVLRLFRWEFLIVSLALVGVWAPLDQSEKHALRVAAREAGASSDGANAVSDLPAQLPQLSLWIPDETANVDLDYRLADATSPESRDYFMDIEPPFVSFSDIAADQEREDGPGVSGLEVQNIRNVGHRPWSPQ